ncbi:hypothetical protein PS893_00351 [Pseudomonas fluorescens]|uniref:hypothetical protein n=1 Tax=Pseudomonas fluorescens TaxID=294 RepID=UPI0012585D43|nr:hypothetical protein [Pseudomonas fluorescens]VVO52314.1 hypothetical protein PS893_00351 [Pseudomonas fluorescens]
MDTTQPAPAAAAGDSQLPFDATLLFKALQYQLLVAVDYCYTLQPGQCLWLEVFGDVTVPGVSQTEVKLYTDKLTDSHTNLWNTLKNWLHESFDRASYQSLILLTTQEFGAQTLLKGWNEKSPSERLEVLETIFAAAQAAKKAAKPTSKDYDSDAAKPSKAQSLQQYVMATERRADLMDVLERMRITTGADSLELRLEKFVTSNLKIIRPSKCQRFIDDLLGFMSSTELVQKGWKVTYEAFTNKLTELTKLHMKHPTTFPPVDVAALKKSIDIEQIKPKLFARKIVEIGGEHQLKRAALHRLVAETTISDLYADGELFKTDVDRYLNNHLERHLYGRESAMLDCSGIYCTTQLKTQSMKFYLDQHATDVEQFCGLESTMTEFRNGIYHMLADDVSGDKDEEFHWRLWNE